MKLSGTPLPERIVIFSSYSEIYEFVSHENEKKQITPHLLHTVLL